MGLFGTKASRQAAKNRLKAKKTKVKAKLKPKVSIRQKLDNAIASKGFVVLAPYKGLMRKALSKRGHPTSSSDTIKTVSLLFYGVVIQNKNHFEYFRYKNLSRTNHLEEADTELIADLAVKSTPNIVQAILNFFKNVLNKKNAGQNLTPDETVMASDIEKAGEMTNKEVIEVSKEEDMDSDKEGFFTRLWRNLFGRKKENFRGRIDRRNKKVTPKPLGQKGNLGIQYGNDPNQIVGMEGASVVHAYEYSQNYARHIKKLSDQAGTLSPLIPNVQGKIGQVKEYRGGTKRVRTSTGWHNV